MNFLIT